MPDYRRRATREAMSVRLDVNGMMAELVGPGGIGRDEVDGLSARVSEIARALEARRGAGTLPVCGLPSDKEAVTRVKALAGEVRAESDTLVVLGTGAASLGTKALLAALSPARRVVVANNVDPVGFGELLDGLDLTRTTFNVVSKSGETAETMAQFLIVRDLLLRQLGAVDYAKHMVITTDAEEGVLRQIVHDEGFRALAVPTAVCGRFAVLSAASLFPAAVAGLPIDDCLAGAAWMDERCGESDVWRNPGFLLGTLLYLADTRHQRHVVVLMPYSDRLRCFGEWFSQLWAGTLGKAETLEGTSVTTGPTPVAALGSTDQYAVLQLLADGPSDKVVIMLRVEDHGRELPVPAAYADLDSIAYLGGVGMGKLLNIEQRATELALVQRARPVLTLSVPQINAFTLGQLFYLFEVGAVFAAALYRVDPSSEPRVEEGKRLIYGLAGRAGFDAQRAAGETWSARKRAACIV